MTASGASAGPSTWIRSSIGATAASRRAKLSAGGPSPAGNNKPAGKTFGGWPITGGNDQAGEPAERRIAGALARIDLAAVKRLAVGRDQRLHHGVFGLVGLQVADAAALIAAGAPDHLVQQLKRP